jgi:hypothetical protein
MQHPHQHLIKVKSRPQHHADKAAFFQSIFQKGKEPIPLSLTHRNIKQFQYTFLRVKSTV